MISSRRQNVQNHWKNKDITCLYTIQNYRRKKKKKQANMLDFHLLVVVTMVRTTTFIFNLFCCLLQCYPSGVCAPRRMSDAAERVQIQITMRKCAHLMMRRFHKLYYAVQVATVSCIQFHLPCTIHHFVCGCSVGKGSICICALSNAQQLHGIQIVLRFIAAHLQ